MGGLTEYRFFAGYATCIVEQPTIAMKIVHYINVVCFFFLLPLGVALVSYYKVFKKIKHQSKHGFDGPRRGQRKSIDCQRDQAYQIARHCCVCLCTVLDSILDHCDDTALRFWCRSTQYPTALSLFDVLLEHYKPIYTRAEFRRILLYKAKSSQFCEELRRPKDVELKKIFEKRPWHRKSRRRGKYLSQGPGGQRSDWTKSKGSQ